MLSFLVLALIICLYLYLYFLLEADYKTTFFALRTKSLSILLLSLLPLHTFLASYSLASQSNVCFVPGPEAAGSFSSGESLLGA